jgi:hypothetical protein
MEMQKTHDLDARHSQSVHVDHRSATARACLSRRDRRSTICTFASPRGRMNCTSSEDAKKRVHMTNEDKQTRIRPLIDPEERITVHFRDAPDLNTIVTACTDQLVDFSTETHMPYMKQHISVPLS